VKFYGKYRGVVRKNTDELNLGRLEVEVPAVTGDAGPVIALPCVPYAGPQVGLYAMPPVGAKVWVEFEGGDLSSPIWSGCFWGPGELPPAALAAAAQPHLVSVLQTDALSMVLDSRPGNGGFRLEVNSPAVSVALRLVCDASGIEISAGPASIKLDGNVGKVALNNDGLEVT
jgi:hypothetical protein